MTLTEFLLARITEDEERALDIEHRTALAFNDDYGQDAKRRYEEAWKSMDAIGFLPTRIRAECRTKRRIMEVAEYATYLDQMADHGYTDPAENLDDKGKPYLGEAMLRALALPYADHPDYESALAIT